MLAETQGIQGILIVLSMLLFMLIHYLVFSRAMRLTCSWSHTFFYSNAGIPHLLPFIVIPPITAILSLKDHYGCIPFRISAFAQVKPYNVYFDNIAMCSSSRVASHISSAVRHSRMFVHVSITFMVIFIPGISSSLFSLGLRLPPAVCDLLSC